MQSEAIQQFESNAKVVDGFLFTTCEPTWKSDSNSEVKNSKIRNPIQLIALPLRQMNDDEDDDEDY